jgi:hypothetical protein
MELSLKLASKDFKALIAAVTRFETIGSFAGSEMVMLSGSKGKLIATSYGVVLSKAEVAAEGDLPLLALDERPLIQFAGTCSEAGDVSIDADEKIVALRFKKTVVRLPVKAGQEHKLPARSEKGIELPSVLAKKIAYLSALAHADSSRPELCCVMLSGKRAISCSPKVFAMLSIDHEVTENAPIPLPLAKEMHAGDVLYPGKLNTTVISGIGRHCMPSLVKAVTDFPLGVVEKYAKTKRAALCTVSLDKLTNMVAQCDSILSVIAKIEIVLCFTLSKGRLALSAKNSNADFASSIQVKGQEVEEAEFHLPMDELQAALALGSDTVTLKSGEKGETYIILDGNDWLMFPAFRSGK